MRKDHVNRGARVEFEDIIEGGESDDKSDSNKEEPELRKEYRKRRSTYFDTPTDKEYGRGKQERKQSTSFSFLQTQFKDMFTEYRSDFSTMPGTNFLERYTSGFIFAQISVKQGFKKYWREAKLQLLA